MFHVALTVVFSVLLPFQSLIEDALRINVMTRGRDEAVREFNGKYLTVREGTSLVDKPHLLYPDSTYYGSNRLDDNILPLAFDFVDGDIREQVIKNVVATIRNSKFRADVSPEVEPYVLKTLCKAGHNELAYFICDDHPDLKTDDCISRKYRDEWLRECVAGISVCEGARCRVRLRPDFSIQELDSLSCCADTPYGVVSSRFVKDLMHAEWYFSVPKGVRAEVSVPTVHRRNVRKRCPARLLRVENGRSIWRVRAGEHHFSIDFDLPDYVEETQFVYKEADFQQCHSSTICFAENGDLLVSFYGGTQEHNPDTKVRLCRKDSGTDFWTAPEAVAEPDKSGYCLDNPVLFRIPEPGEPVLLFYKIRPGGHMKENGIDVRTNAFWEARLKKSFDNGRTWTSFETLPDSLLGPIKDKPVYCNGRLVCGSSFEYKYHHISNRIHFEWTDDKCRTWHYCRPDDVEYSIPCRLRAPGRVGENEDVAKVPEDPYGTLRPVSSIQPTIFVHKDGTLQALCRTDNGRMSQTWSHDNGETWSREVLTDMPQNGSGIDGTTMKDGRFALVYNDFESLPGVGGGPRTPLVLAVSDDGVNWKNVLVLEDDPIKEYSYPAIICDDENCLHITYTWRRYRVKYVKVRIPSQAFGSEL